jgi:hypothetical protein
MMPGGFTNPDTNISLEKRKLFDDSTKCLAGVEYKPVSVATQIVAGTNYRFACEVTPLSSGAGTYSADVYIFQPLPTSGGEPYIYQILQTKS